MSKFDEKSSCQIGPFINDFEPAAVLDEPSVPFEPRQRQRHLTDCPTGGQQQAVERSRFVAACRNEPRTLDSLLLATGRAIGEVALALARLERDGWLIENGGWFEVVDEWADLT